MINNLALAEYLPVLLTITAIAALLIGVPYQLNKTYEKLLTKYSFREVDNGY